MFAAVPLTLALASVAAALPISNAVLASVDASMSLPNSTQTNNATSYYQAGNAGACGLYSQDSDVVVGLPLEFYNETGSVSPYCGSYVVVINPANNETVTSRVADASATSDLLSLSQATWKVLNFSSTEAATVTWRFANETETAAAKAAAASTSSTAASTTVASTSAEAVSTSSSSSAAKAYTSSSVVAAAAVETTSSSSAPSSTSKYVAPSTTSKYVAPSTTTTTSKYVAPSTTKTTTQAAATQAAYASSSSSSDSYSGQATYFYQNGVAGACGSVNSDSAYIVAMDSRMYSGGSHCGQTVVITGNGKTISAKVADECPTCASSGSLDLSYGAFTALASTDAGVVSITWHFA